MRPDAGTANKSAQNTQSSPPPQPQPQTHAHAEGEEEEEREGKREGERETLGSPRVAACISSIGNQIANLETSLKKYDEYIQQTKGKRILNSRTSNHDVSETSKAPVDPELSLSFIDDK